MDFRVNISKSSHSHYKALTSGASSVFPQMSDMFFWCVVLGYKNKIKRKPLLKKEAVFNWNTLDIRMQIPVLKMIAVKEHGNFTILDKDNSESFDAFRNILEEYAEAGLEKLLEKFQESSMITSEALFSILIDEYSDIKK